MKNTLSALLRTHNSVFTFNELALLLRITHPHALRAKIHYYIKTGALYHIRKGVYAKDKNYDALECSTKIYTPAYVSFETVLAQHGVIFQLYKKIFVAAYLNRTIECDTHEFQYRKIKSSVLTNTTGLIREKNYFIADKERAFLDTIYLNKEYYFDNLRTINWEKCFEMISIYENKQMEKRLKQYYKENTDAKSSNT